ncbi:hypothetical protein [Pedobacter sp. V48]|uniref:hypothetical protein n=1 Tax=Pedobacter sp. V48 TaxID=509635 RepID=UPI0003E53DFD|nr:hypothetical protein [Pedobacter sp. V48]ETZ19138.1 hypothetical protein N824_10370 [Pedobacter sp. V48]
MKDLHTDYPECLYNSAKDLKLGTVYLRYLDLPIPALITIFELERPAVLAYNQFRKIMDSLENQPDDEFSCKGLFVLAIAQFETMLNDLMIKILQFYPQKLSLLKGVSTDEKTTGLAVGQEQLLNGEVINQIIEASVNRVAYGSLDNFLKLFAKVFAIDLKDLELEQILDELIEIKETRNLLLHNNLVVNELYIKKTAGIKRSTEPGRKLSVDKDYVLRSLNLIADLIYSIIVQVRQKYGHFTVLPLLKKLFAYNFTSPIIKFEEFCVLNEGNDIYDGPFNMPAGRASSENFFLEFWQAQRDGGALNGAAMVHLGGSVRKLAFLTEVFGEFRFPYW